MKEREFVNACEDCEINKEIVSEIESLYKVSLPDDIKRCFSFVPDDYFCGKWRILSSKEILLQQKWMAQDLVSSQTIPLIDIGNVEYISYLAVYNKWAIVSDVDGVCFRYKDNLRDYLKDTSDYIG